jgi:hypothetical protein
MTDRLPKKIAFLMPPADHGEPGQETWRSVSVRVRCTEIAQWLGRYGTQVRLVVDNNLTGRLSGGALDDTEAVVVLQSQRDYRTHVDMLRAAGKCVVVDVCDDVWRYSGVLATTWESAGRAHAITVPTRWLKDSLQPKTDIPIHIVPDAVEGLPGPIRLPSPEGPLRLFWYGWQHKVSALRRHIDRLRAFAKVERPVELTVMTNMDPVFDELADLLAAGGGALSVTGVPWSMDGFGAAMDATDIALIPFDRAIDFSGRSPLKLMQALWQGRLAVSEDLDSYPDFARFGVLHGDIVDGIRALLADPEGARIGLAKAQRYIRDTYVPPVLARRWQATLGEIVDTFENG